MRALSKEKTGPKGTGFNLFNLMLVYSRLPNNDNNIMNMLMKFR